MIHSINGTYLYSPVYTTSAATITNASGASVGSVSSDNGKASVFFETNITYTSMLASNRLFGSSDTNYIYPTTVNNYTNFDASPGTNWLAEFTMGNTQTTPAGEMYTSPPFSASGSSVITSYHARSYDESDYWIHSYPSGGKSYYSKSPSPSNGTWASIQAALTDPNIQTTNHGVQIEVYTTLSGTYQMPDTRDSLDAPLSMHTVTNSIGNITMNINISNDATEDDIKNALAKIKGIDIYSSNYGRCDPYEAPSLNTKMIDQTIYEAQIELNIQTSDVAHDHIDIAYKSLRLQNLGLADTNTKNFASAQKAIAKSANALSIISEQRSLFGAYQNRLKHAQAVAANTAENSQSAESRLRDADISQEMLTFSKIKILTQAGESILAQANSNKSQVLSLLQGN